MQIIVSILSVLGFNGILLFFIKRYFSKKDPRDQKEREKRESIYNRIDATMDTIRLLAYARMSEEIDRLLKKGYATPPERRILGELYQNYKAHGWNGDMDERLHMVYMLPISIEKQQCV